ncbi:molecular chaperone Hsp70 [Penicillium nucicola]|uniref:molecular chaperone Hsp70 n=1 Tax=Penicillium nucicola TaxID=1850975 RepID=UPI0025458FC1|nr:molecular chaperone Hsp70 [Penicillium nucicola]KAJ5751522.1 molecular chaperone Hsp70 [Penicillium nucicola]
MRLVEQVLQDAKTDKQFVHEIALIPALISDFFPKEANQSANSDEAVTHGATVSSLFLFIKIADRDKPLNKLSITSPATRSVTSPHTQFSEASSPVPKTADCLVTLDSVDKPKHGWVQPILESSLLWMPTVITVSDDKGRLNMKDVGRMLLGAKKCKEDDEAEIVRLQAMRSLKSHSYAFNSAITAGKSPRSNERKKLKPRSSRP